MLLKMKKTNQKLESKKGHFLADFIELNLAVLFISTSGVLGKHIDMPVPTIIFLRALMASLVLYIYSKIKKFDFRIPRKDRLSLFVGGIFLAAHWITYFYSLKYSNVAVAMISLYTFPVITAILEPIILKEKLQRIHLLLGLIILIGIYLIVPNFSLKNDYFFGVSLGLLSAFFYSIRNILLKANGQSYNQSIVMLNQLGIMAIVLVPTLFSFDNSNIPTFLPEVALLAVLTTAIGHTLFVSSMKKFSITSASLISSMQPVYGILLALIILGEYPKWNTIAGGVVIASTVLIESIRVRNKPG